MAYDKIGETVAWQYEAGDRFIFLCNDGPLSRYNGNECTIVRRYADDDPKEHEPLYVALFCENTYETIKESQLGHRLPSDVNREKVVMAKAYAAHDALVDLRNYMKAHRDRRYTRQLSRVSNMIHSLSGFIGQTNKHIWE